MERKLASIQLIDAIRPIEGADRIECATVLGWEVVVSKSDNFKVGDPVIYIEVDSILPVRPEFEFLAQRHYRVRTIKLRKQVSQGLVLPVKYLDNYAYATTKTGERVEIRTFRLGEDVTDLLEIRKYDPQGDLERAQLERKSVESKNRVHTFLYRRMNWYRRLTYFFTGGRLKWPEFITKTDEPRIQNLKDVCEVHKNTAFTTTEKLDGCMTGRMLIQTDAGELSISSIVNHKLDVKVLTYNEELKITEYKRILDYHRINRSQHQYKIGVGFRGKGNRAKYVECTANHEFITPTGNVRADKLKVGDTLLHKNAKTSQEIDQVLLGCLLGDASISSNSESGNYKSVHFSHSIKQKEYFDYKKVLLGKVFLESTSVVSGYGSEMVRGHTRTNQDILSLVDTLCLVDEKKTVTPEWVNALTPLSLAFWYMDDGSIQNREEENRRCRIQLNTQGFSLEEVSLLSEAMGRKFNIFPSVGDKETYKGYVLILDADNTEKFCSLIFPYICSSMKYKLPKEYEDFTCVLENKELPLHGGVTETTVVSVEQVDELDAKGVVFDLTIEDNHNYFSQSVLVHNCSATYFVIKNKRRFLWFGEKYKFGVCSRNYLLGKKDNSTWWRIAEQQNIKNKLIDMISRTDFEYIVLQGEIVGEGIQGNKYGIKGIDFYAFNLKTPYGPFDQAVMDDELSIYFIKTVPTVDRLWFIKPTVRECVEYAKGKSVLADVKREGVVVRHYLSGTSFKIINPEFLLEHEE